MDMNNSLLNKSGNAILPIKLIAIDGRGGSGKSTLANLLAAELKAEIIHTDDFASWDNPENWWPLLIDRIIDPIKNGAKTLSYPRSKWWENHSPSPVINQPVKGVMILEGVSSLRKEFRPYLALGIFVNAPKEICIERGVARDLSTGKSREELLEIWEGWYVKETAYINRDSPQDFASIVLDGTKSFEEQLGIIYE